MLLKPHDLLVALKLVALGTERWTYASLAKGLGLSVSESHACVQRGVRSGLLLLNRDIHSVDEAARATVLSDAIYPMGRRQPRPRGPGAKASDNPVRPHDRMLAEFVIHGARFVFVPDRTPMTIGVATSHSAPAFAGVFAPGSDDYVWPHPNGSVRGLGIEPLHPCVPFAAIQDEKLYDMLALFDALRVGRARERGMARERLHALLDPNTPRPPKPAAKG
ncbi:MAG: hypothetical protein RJA98_1319 [Pseudomonadota bacterium]|jgi:hypothetical protein